MNKTHIQSTVVDLSIFAVFAGVLALVFAQTSLLRLWWVYLLIGVVFFVLQLVSTATAIALKCIDVLVSENNPVAVKQQAAHMWGRFAAMAARGSYHEWVYALLQSVAFVVALYFVVELTWFSGAKEWYTSTFVFPDPLHLCSSVKYFEEAAKWFFDITSNPLVRNALLAAYGLYFDILLYRAKARQFFVTAYPDIKRACDGGPMIANISESLSSQVCVVTLAFLAALLPFTLLREGRRFLRSPLFWVAAFIIGVLLIAGMHLIYDIGTLFFGLITSSYRRSFTYHGILGTVCLGVFTCTCFLLILPWRTLLFRPNNQFELEEMARRGRKYHESRMRFFTSQSLYLGFITLGLAALIALQGFPVTDVTFVNNRSYQPWPTYANLDSFERGMTDARSIRELLQFTIGNNTESTLTLLTKLIDKGGCRSFMGLGSVCVSDLLPLSHIKGTLVDLQSDSIGWTIDALLLLIDQVPGFSISELERKIMLLVSGITDEFTGLADVVRTLGNIVRFLPSLLPWVPLLFAAFVLVLAVLGRVSPAVSNGLYLAVMVGIVQIVCGVGLLVLTLRYILGTYGFELVIVWNKASIGVCITTLFTLFASSLMLFSYDAHEDDLYTEAYFVLWKLHMVVLSQKYEDTKRCERCAGCCITLFNRNRRDQPGKKKKHPVAHKVSETQAVDTSELQPMLSSSKLTIN